MPSRGLVAAALLVSAALFALASLRRVAREHLLLARLGHTNPRELALEGLSPEERYTAQDLARAGVLTIQGRRVRVQATRLAAFRARRLRLLFSGGFVALVLVSVVVLAVLRR